MTNTNKNKVTRLVGKCPVCEGDFKLTPERKLVHHGFKRPGDGQIHGDCFAVGYEPYELSCEATKDYRVMVQSERTAHTNALYRLQNGLVKKLTIHSWIRGKAEEIDSTDPRWARELARIIDEHARAIRRLDAEIARCDKLISEWSLKPVRTVEEIEGLNAAERKAKSDKRAQDKADKLQAKIEGYRKRLTTAVKNKTASTIADIFESAPSKLRDMTGCTRAEAFAMLDRNSVFEAFELDLASDDWRGPNADKLAQMKYNWNKDLMWPANLK